MNLPPIIRLELEGMQESLNAVIMSRSDEWAKLADAAISQALSDENVKDLITRNVSIAVNEVLVEAIHEFYRYGPGKKQIKEAALEALSKSGLSQETQDA